MTKTFLISDTHFGHNGVCQFTVEDQPLRPWDNAHDMDEALIENWNGVVGPKDRVYVLGDLCINRRALDTVARCNGKKVLVKGNHDIFKLHEYARNFEDVRAYVVKPKIGIIMSHIPIHPGSLKEGWVNIHGHLHSRAVADPHRSTAWLLWREQKVVYEGIPDPRYYSVCVERTNYTPVDLEVVLKEIGRKRNDDGGYNLRRSDAVPTGNDSTSRS